MTDVTREQIINEINTTQEFEAICNSFNEDLKGCYDEASINSYDALQSSNVYKLQHKVLSMFQDTEENNRFLLSKDKLAIVDTMKWGELTEQSQAELMGIIANFKENKERIHHENNPYSRQTKDSKRVYDSIINQALHNPHINPIEERQIYMGKPTKGLDIIITRALHNPNIKPIE